MRGINKNFKLLSYGTFVSFGGNSIQITAISLYMLDLTGSGAMMASLILASMIPSIITLPLAGVIGDKLNRKYIMVIMDFIRGCLTLYLSIIFYFGKLTLTILFLVTVIMSIMDSIFNASNSAIITELLNKSDYIKGNSLMSGIKGITSMIGPIIGGTLYGLTGMGSVFLINSISFYISSIFEIKVCYRGSRKTKLTYHIFQSEVKAGLLFIRKCKPLIYVVSFATILNLFYIPLITLFVPIVLKKHLLFSSIQFGITQSILTFGILIGNIFLVTIAKNLDIKTKIKRGLVERALCTVIFSIFALPVPVEYLCKLNIKILFVSIVLLVIGISSSFIDTPFTTILQNLIPNEMRSRVFSSISFLFKASVPGGIALYGLLIELIPDFIIIMCISSLSLITTLIFIITAPNEIYNI